MSFCAHRRILAGYHGVTMGMGKAGKTKYMSIHHSARAQRRGMMGRRAWDMEEKAN